MGEEISLPTFYVWNHWILSYWKSLYIVFIRIFILNTSLGRSPWNLHPLKHIFTSQYKPWLVSANIKFSPLTILFISQPGLQETWLFYFNKTHLLHQHVLKNMVERPHTHYQVDKLRCWEVVIIAIAFLCLFKLAETNIHTLLKEPKTICCPSIWKYQRGGWEELLQSKELKVTYGSSAMNLLNTWNQRCITPL